MHTLQEPVVEALEGLFWRGVARNALVARQETIDWHYKTLGSCKQLPSRKARINSGPLKPFLW